MASTGHKLLDSVPMVFFRHSIERAREDSGYRPRRELAPPATSPGQSATIADESPRAGSLTDETLEKSLDVAAVNNNPPLRDSSSVDSTCASVRLKHRIDFLSVNELRSTARISAQASRCAGRYCERGQVPLRQALPAQAEQPCTRARRVRRRKTLREHRPSEVERRPSASETTTG